METLKFNSTIKCTGCLAKVTPILDEVAGENNWDVDLENPNKVLSVKSYGVSAEAILQALDAVGYSAKSID